MTGSSEQSPERPRIAAMERGPGPGRYTLPSLTGSRGHDVCKKIFPSYSFGLKLGTSFFRNDFGPGPAHGLDPSVTRTGKDGTPHYSLYSRRKELEPFKTPGPGSYAPEQHSHPYSARAPTHVIGVRTRYRKRDSTPAPCTYTLPKMIGDHLPTRTSSATFKMTSRSKLGGFDTDYAKTPGPAGYRVTSADVLHRKAPGYSMLSRRFMPGDTTVKPGPGAHSPEKVKVTKKAAPAVTMGIKHSEYICPLIIDTSE